jgi:SAM-dependent methyltransferase
VPRPPANALDAGCGDGLNAVFLATRGYRVTGIDASPVALERAREHTAGAGVDVSFVPGDVREMSKCLKDSFSLAIDNKTFHSLWSYEGRDRYLRELYGVLRPNAALFFRQCCAPAELRDEFGWTEFQGKPFDPALRPEDGDVPPDGPGVWPNSLPKYQEQLRHAGFKVERAVFYRGDPEPVSVVWCVRT